MDETQKKIVKDVFFGLRQLERAAGKLIKKMTALDKMLKGVYKPSQPQNNAASADTTGTPAQTDAPTTG